MSCTESCSEKRCRITAPEHTHGGLAFEDVPAPPQIPYRGIQPFRYVDHAIFFARENETRELLQLVAVYRGVLLYGESGVGKSSLINAGLLPVAVQRGFQPERVRVQPRRGEEIVITRIAVEEEGGRSLPSLFSDAGEGPAPVVLSCDDFSERVRAASASSRPLLVFDQFEELVTLFDDAEDLASQRRIGEMLGALLRDEVAAKLLFVFREDYLASVKPLLAAAPELIDQALRLRAPAPDALPTIIRGPFERHPNHFDHELRPELAERLRLALADRFGSGAISLSEVQTVCLRLWRSDDPESLLAAKRVEGLLEDYLGEELDRFPADLRYAAGALLSQMVTSAGTRNVISAEDLIGRVQNDERIPRPLLEQALERLERESKLVRRERRRELYLYEITSEFLLPWIGRRRKELVRNRERRLLRRRLLVSGAVGVALALVALIALLGFVSARHQRSKAQSKAAEAKASADSARAALMLETDPAEALKTALSAAQAFQNKPGRPHDQALSVLSQAALASQLIAVLRSDTSRVVAAGFSKGGALITVLASGQADVWIVGTAQNVTVRRVGVMHAKGSVTKAKFSRDGSLLAIRNRRGWSIWDLGRRRSLRTLPRGVLAMSPDGRRVALAVGGRRRPYVRLFLFARPSFRERPSLRFARRGAWRFASLSFSADSHRLLGVSTRGQWAVWDLGTRQIHTATQAIGTNARLLGATVAATLSRNGRTVGVVANKGSLSEARTLLRLYDVGTGRHVGTRGLGPPLSSADNDGDGNLVLADQYGSAQVWRPHPRAEPIVLSGHTRPVTSAVSSDDGAWIATASADLTTRIWDARTGKLRTTLLGHTDRIRTLMFNSTGARVVTTSADGTARLWRTFAANDVALPRHRDEVGHVVFSADGRSVLTTGLEDSTFLVSAANGALRHPFTQHPIGVPSACRSFAEQQLDPWYAIAACDARAALNAAGNRLVTGSDRPGGAVLWTPTGKPKRIKTLAPKHAAAEATLFVGPQHHWVAVAQSFGGIELFDAATGAKQGELPKSDSRIAPLAVAASASGRYLVAGETELTPRVQVWDVPARQSIGAWRTRGLHHPKMVAIDPSGTYAAVGLTGGEVRIWRIRDGVLLSRVTMDNFLRGIAFSPNGETLAIATDGSSVTLWSTTRGRRTATLHGHLGGVNSVEFSPDSKLLVTASDDGTVRVWDAQHGVTRAVFRQGRPGRALDASFDPSGARIVVGASDGGSDIYECPVCVGENALFRFARKEAPPAPVRIDG